MITTILIVLIGNVFIISISCIISYIIKKNNNNNLNIFTGKLDSTNIDTDNFVKYLRCTDSFVNYYTD